MLIIETTVFTRCIKELMSDDDYALLQKALVIRPDQGALIPRSGGLRKLRWKLEGQGKRGGVRVIYYWQRTDAQLYMLSVYAKAHKEDLTAQQLAALRKIVERWNDG